MNTAAIKKIKDFETLTHFLTNELQWPFPDPDDVDVEDLTFDYTPDEIGLSEEFATKVKSIKQIQPLDKNQPWSIFWIDFENKKLPLTVLRRILSAFVTKKRANTRNLATKALDDIMFVSGHGTDHNRAITFAHFKKLDDQEVIREFYWDKHETSFDNIVTCLKSLTWPDKTNDVEAWKERWKKAFTGSTREAIKTSDQLATAMAGVARNIRDKVLEVLSIEKANGPVHKLYDTFREGLVHDMTEQGFADMYAQTITYGLFSARTMDTDGHFELHEVVDLIPQTNPFLKNLFKECLNAGDKKHKIDLDELGVGKLVELFDSLNRSDGNDTMMRILAEFGRQTGSGNEDPVIHFYEGFLGEYDKTQKVEKGVFYTPDPVVSFIVRSVNEQLKTEFGLEMGLADTTTWAEMVGSGRAKYPKDPKTGKENSEWRERIKGRAFVQILDPATGTGTFIKHIIEIIHEEVKGKYKRENKKSDWVEYWNSYVYQNLLPRIYGFELMMASYSVAHMKIGMYLKSLGYKFEKEQRLNIYLTNSLEDYTSNIQTNFFFTSVGSEALGANNIKQNRYFSVVIGNPPYSGESKNKGEWIMGLMNDYKKEPGGVEKLKERNPKWINDDYVKFVRFGQYFLQKNGSGILAFINPHGFLDNPTFRGMRWNLLRNYDNIYTLDLHGNSNKKETFSKDVTQDGNVFDIMQGVSVNIFVKTGKKKADDLGKISNFDLFGKRELKYDFLIKNELQSVPYREVRNMKPNYFFVVKNLDGQDSYEKGFSVAELFTLNNIGIVTAKDSVLVSEKKSELLHKVEEYYGIQSNVNFIKMLSYRPFDTRFVYYDTKLIERAREKVMVHYLKGSNIGLLTTKALQDDSFRHVFVTDNISEAIFLSGTTASNAINFPVFIYPQPNAQINTNSASKRSSNLDPTIISKISKELRLTFSVEKEETEGTFAAVDVFDYVYAALHSITYRKKYKEFLKFSFPRVPYPKDKEAFWYLVKLGEELRKIHLMETNANSKCTIHYPIAGNNEISKIEYKESSVWINKTQHFSYVSQVAWQFYIGGYQPAQKWLKDRKGRMLTANDIIHYQKIIVALTETDRIMKEIDKIEM
jgi:predicted helicase